MQKLDGFDDRTLVLEDDHLTVERWGDLVERISFRHLKPAEIVQDDKKDFFGNVTHRIRIRFGPIATTMWLEAEREQEARLFADAVEQARQG